MMHQIIIIISPAHEAKWSRFPLMLHRMKTFCVLSHASFSFRDVNYISTYHRTMRGSPWSVRLPGLLQVVVVCAFCSPALADVYEPDVDKVVTLFEKDDGQGNSTEIYWHQKDLEEDWASVTQKGMWVFFGFSFL